MQHYKNSELHVLTVGPDYPHYELPEHPADFEDVLRESSRGTVSETHLCEGRADEEIVELAEEIEAGLIVMGSRGHGKLRRALLGSVSGAVVQHAHCPVTIVRE
jgi:nucleotide-binding universal stress UspA family protein